MAWLLHPDSSDGGQSRGAAPLDESPLALSAAEADVLTEHVAQLSESGLPLEDGLRAAALEAPSGRLARAIQAAADHLAQGRSLAEVLTSSGGPLPAYARLLLEAGARGGAVAPVLSELVEHARLGRQLRREMWTALSYPLLLAVMLYLLIVLLSLVVVDQLQGLYNSIIEFQLDFDLPVATSVLFWFGDTGVWMVLAATVIAACLLLVVRVASPVAWCRLMASLPFVGRLWLWSGMTRALSMTAVLVRENTPLPAALRQSGEAAGDAHLARVWQKLADEVDAGRPFSDSLAETSLPATLTPLVRWGEQSGELAEALRTAADMFESRVRSRVALVRTVFPPIAVVCVGAMALFLFAALILPMGSLLNMVGGLW